MIEDPVRGSALSQVAGHELEDPALGGQVRDQDQQCQYPERFSVKKQVV
jgi:hypothetical protein